MKERQKSIKSSTATATKPGGFTPEERAAMRDRVKELKGSVRRGPSGAKADESDVLAKIAEMTPSDRAMGERVHALIRANAPTLTPRLWYGMPAYATDGSAVCVFRGAQTFKRSDATLGFSDKAKLDAG